MYNTIAEDNNLIKVDAIGFYFRFTMWAEFEVYYSKQKRMFFWLEDEGCSCWELGEDMKSLDELCNGDKRAAAEAVRLFLPAGRKSEPKKDSLKVTSRLLLLPKRSSLLPVIDITQQKVKL